MSVEVYESETGFAALREAWNTLLRRSPTDTVFLTWEWQSLWWSAYHPGVLFIVAVRDDAGELIGIAPWFIDTTEPSERVLRGIGCIDVTDYVDVIAAPEHFDAVMTTLADVLTEHTASFTRINLCNVRAASPTLTSLRAALDSAGFQTEQAEQEVCPVIPLPATFIEYIERLDKKNRHELRRKLRLAEGSRELTMKIIGADDDLNASVDQFIALMAESTEQKATFLQNQQHVNFVYNDRVMVYNSGLSLAHGHLSPGIILLCYLIRDAIEQRCMAFDFLRGDEEYKFRMGGIAEPIYMLKARLS